MRKVLQPRICQTCQASYVPTGGAQKFCQVCTPADTFKTRARVERIKADPAALASWHKQKRDSQRAHRIRLGVPVRPAVRFCATCAVTLPPEMHANMRYCGDACRDVAWRTKERNRATRRRERERDEVIAAPQRERQRVLLGGCLGCRHSILEDGRPRCALKRLLACDPNGPRGPKLKEAV